MSKFDRWSETPTLCLSRKERRILLKQLPKGSPMRFSRFVPSSDDFYPSYENGTVEVSVHLAGGKTLLLCAWGADDFGLEKLEDFDNKGEAKAKYRQKVREIIKWSVVSIKMLEEMGWERA